jgi:hypothetical protein
MNPNSSTVSAGQAALASQYNNLRKDVANSTLTYYTSAGSLSAYTVVADSQITTYSAGLVLEVKINHTNTGSATLNVNSYGVKSIKKNITNNLDYADLKQNQIARFIYDGTNFQYLQDKIRSFGGDGSDGILNVTSGTTSIDASGANIVVKNYLSINVSAGAVLNLTNKATTGTILVLRSVDNTTIAGTVNLVGSGASANENGYLILDALTTHDGNNGTGVGSGTGGSGGTVYNSPPLGMLYTTPVAENIVIDRNYRLSCGSGGGNGVAGAGTTGGTAGAGGSGGGVVILECGGALNFTGQILADGEKGADGGDGSGTGAGAGGGGGGAAGMILVMYNLLTANTGTASTKGGAGGAGGDGVTTVWTGDAGGGGGGGAGSYTAGGENGGAGGINSAPPVAGTNTTDASGAGGGGGGAADLVLKNGANGGSQGSNDSNHYLVIKNTIY